jgi:hypothetical protein
MMPGGVGRVRVSAGVAILLALAVAPALEPIQHAVGRSWRPDPADVAWHLAGATIGVGAWAVLRMARVTAEAWGVAEGGEGRA